MSSVVPGFEYDIFISYRHNDNRSGWVNEFVKALQEELAATIKESVSVYFDTNLHDGLLENHDVDDSLKGKLKCLIFIPVVSQTYCDPKSFAWRNEFLSFKKLASEDRFGLKVKLQNGNVASRILPVRIHELEKSDQQLIESELGMLRAVDFIYRSAGVVRPLLSREEDAKANLDHSFYRDQITKVVRAIKELILAIEAPVPVELNQRVKTPETIPKARRTRISIVAGVVLVLGIISFSIFYFTGVKTKIVEQQNSIAVLPFVNLSNDPEQEYFCDGTTEQVISSLARLKDLKVIARTSVLQYKKTTKTIAQIGKELNVTHVLESSVRKSGNQIRVTAQLIAVKDETHLWAEDFDNKLVADIFQIQDAVATKIASSLKNQLLPEEKERLKSEKPSNTEAYEHFLKGEYIHANYFAVKFLNEDFLKAENEFKAAIQLDSTYASAYAGLANLYDTRRFTFPIEYSKLVTKYAEKAYRLNPELPYSLVVKFESWKDWIELQLDSAIRKQQLDSAYKYIKKAYEIAPNNIIVCSEFGFFLARYLGLFREGLIIHKHAVEMDPFSSWELANQGLLLYGKGDIEQAEHWAEKAIGLDPNSLLANRVLFLINCDKKNFQQADQLFKTLKEVNPNSKAIPFLEGILYAAKGKKEKSLSIGKSLPGYLFLGMKNEAITELQKNLSEHVEVSYMPLLGDKFKTLRGDPRFEKILAQTKVQYEQRLKKYGQIDLPKN